MIRQPERGNRNVNDIFYTTEGRHMQKLNKVLDGIELTRREEKTLLWLAGWEDSTIDDLVSVIRKVSQKQYLKPSAFERAKYPLHKSVDLCNGYFATASSQGHQLGHELGS